MLGQTNIRTTQIYARITDQKVNNDMAILAEKIEGTLPQRKHTANHVFQLEF